MIDEVLAGGTKQGYEFRLTTVDPEYVWFVTVSPTVPGETGDRYFGGNMAGLIFFNSKQPVQFRADGSSTNAVLGN